MVIVFPFPQICSNCALGTASLHPQIFRKDKRSQIAGDAVALASIGGKQVLHHSRGRDSPECFTRNILSTRCNIIIFSQSKQIIHRGTPNVSRETSVTFRSVPKHSMGEQRHMQPKNVSRGTLALQTRGRAFPFRPLQYILTPTYLVYCDVFRFCIR